LQPSVAVRPNPVLFTLPAASQEASKENTSPKNDRRQPGLPYRSIFAVLTWDSVLVYDTCQAKPLSIARGLHYANLADATWSADGLNLVVCSTDGYISIISFAPGELGDVYTPPLVVQDVGVAAPVSSTGGTLATNNTTNAPKYETTASMTSVTVTPSSTVPSRKVPLANPNQVLLPPCEPGQTATITAPPAKRAKKVRITPTLVTAAPVVTTTATATTATTAMNTTSTNMSTTSMPSSKRPASYDDDDDDADHVGKAVDKLSLDSSGAGGTLEETKPKKKKRIQPMLLSSSVQQN
jgi:chromatin assembly factor 1 subunit B